MTDARERFLREIADRLPPERIEEVHLFPPLRQGGVESGVAVVAADVMEVAEEAEGAGGRTAEGAEGTASADLPAADLLTADTIEEQLPLADVLTEPACDPTEAAAGPPPRARPRRHTVYTARYRHTLKGPERGKWEFDLVAEADAPLVTVETVVRGVQKRSGELADPERLRPDDLRTALDDTPWRATTG
jgi:hypothetical protein